MLSKPIDGKLSELEDEIKKYAIDYGLDFYPVVFEMCGYDTINILAAQGGFPTRYPHWKFGMEYDRLSKGYAYGIQKIYEMVINTKPVYAYLLSVNNWVDQKIVMAHVYGHADFFKNNAWFKTTDKSMMDVMANNGTKIRRYMEKYGQDVVEKFIDRVHSLENLLDIDVLFETPEVRRSRLEKEKESLTKFEEGDDGRSSALQSFMRSKLAPKKPVKEEEKKEPTSQNSGENYVSKRDLMMYLLKYAPLKEWQADILGILREEAYYFLPQRLTKIMNEGWASYWHAKIMTKKAADASEIIDFADKHAGVVAMSRKQINPYKIGIELFRDIEHRWDTGKFGKEYNECTNMYERENWNKPTNLGKEKIFEVRASHNDITFIDTFFTKEFCERQQLFTYKYNSRSGRFEIDKKDFEGIKQKLLNSLTNFGSPIIEVEDGNYENRGELLLKHVHQGVDLDMNYAHATMENIYALWSRPVNLFTIQEGKEVGFSFDGQELKSLQDK